jgi:hypothetical protein
MTTEVKNTEKNTTIKFMGQNKKQTSIEWLVEEINKRKAWANPQILEPLINQAKEMEEDALFDCWVASHEAYMTSENYREKKEFDKYYQKTYEQ